MSIKPIEANDPYMATQMYRVQDVKDMESEIATLKAQMEWVSVEDRLPGETCWCLVYYDGAMRTMAYDKDCCEFMAWDSPRNLTIHPGLVTHWMPLPDPPESEVSDE